MSHEPADATEIPKRCNCVKLDVADPSCFVHGRPRNRRYPRRIPLDKRHHRILYRVHLCPRLRCGALFLAPLSEVYGRSPVYHASNVLFVIWTLACSFAPNIGALLVFRFFEGVAGVCALTIGSGTIANLIPAESRGAFMSVYSLGPLLGPVIGPIAGAFLSEKEGWRWVFRVLTIAVSYA